MPARKPQPWHRNRESVFRAMRDLDAVVQGYYCSARRLAPRGGTLPVGSADFDFTLKAEVGSTYLRTLRTGGSPADALAAAKRDGDDAVAKWNATGHKGRVTINGPHELKRWDGAGSAVADHLHALFIALLPQEDRT